MHGPESHVDDGAVLDARQGDRVSVPLLAAPEAAPRAGAAKSDNVGPEMKLTNAEKIDSCQA